MLKTTKSAGFQEYKVVVNNIELTIFNSEYGSKNPANWVACRSNGKIVIEANTKSFLLKKLETKQIN